MHETVFKKIPKFEDMTEDEITVVKSFWKQACEKYPYHVMSIWKKLNKARLKRLVNVILPNIFYLSETPERDWELLYRSQCRVLALYKPYEFTNNDLKVFDQLDAEDLEKKSFRKSVIAMRTAIFCKLMGRRNLFYVTEPTWLNHVVRGSIEAPRLEPMPHLSFDEISEDPIMIKKMREEIKELYRDWGRNQWVLVFLM